MKNVITSKCCNILQILLQILTWEGETYRLIYNLSAFGGVRSLKIRHVSFNDKMTIKLGFNDVIYSTLFLC